MIALTVNGTAYRLETAPDMPLLWAIRELVGLTGTKYACGVAQCGACTVHLDGAIGGGVSGLESEAHTDSQ
jgi:isoquinoline 1-oxidoreductase alpha subunit